MFLPEILLELEFLLLIKSFQNFCRVGLRNRDGIQSFALKVNDEAVGFVVQHAHLLDVDDIGTVAAHQTAGIHAVVGDGLHLATQHVARNSTAALIEDIDIIVLRLDVVEVVELDGQLQVAVVVHQVDDLGVLGHHFIVRFHRVALGEHEALSCVFQQDRQYGNGVRHSQGDKGDEDALRKEIAETVVGGADLEIGNQSVDHRDDHDFEEKPEEIEPKGEMPALSDDPIHQQSAEYQEHGASAYKSGGDEEIVSSSHLEPCRFRERDVSRQKHQREQRRDNDIEHLSDGFGQALRRLRYQAFWDFHRLFLKIRGKNTKNLFEMKKLWIRASPATCLARHFGIMFFFMKIRYNQKNVFIFALSYH